MKTIPFTELCYTNFDFAITNIFSENWSQRKEFSLYQSKPRPCSALFFVCSDMEVTFFSASGIREISAHNGDVLFIPKGIQYFVRVSDTSNQNNHTYTINLNFYDNDRNEFLFSNRFTLLTHFHDNRYEIHLKKLNNAFHIMKETPFGQKNNFAKTKGEFFLLLDLIEASVSENTDFYYPIRKGAEAFCEEWNQNEKIEKYAQLSEVSTTYFYRCFGKWAGKSPVAYRNMIRLSNAESLLQSTDMEIQEISKSIGFKDPFYFCRLFTEIYGLSPKHYRKHYQKNSN